MRAAVPAKCESAYNSSTVLVGMKSDKTAEREVLTMEGLALASKLNVPFVETSAKDDINIRRAVFACIRLLDDRRSNKRPSQPESRPSMVSCLLREKPLLGDFSTNRHHMPNAQKGVEEGGCLADMEQLMQQLLSGSD